MRETGAVSVGWVLITVLVLMGAIVAGFVIGSASSPHCPIVQTTSGR